MRTTAVLSAIALLASASAAHAWPDTALGRLKAQAVMEEINGALLASPSATATLEAWCGDELGVRPAHLIAIRVANADKPVTAAQRALLQVGPNEPVGYRRVRLTCGGRVLSEADNWYVPARLTPAMNRVLQTTDTPFGRAIADLHAVRQTISVERLWSPLSAGWERPDAPSPADGAGALAVPDAIFRHTAVLYDEQRRPVSEVVETYAGALLDVAP